MRRKDVDVYRRLYTAWLGALEALDLGSLWSLNDDRYAATKCFLRRFTQIRDVNVDNLPVLSFDQLLEPECRKGRENLLRSTSGDFQYGPFWGDDSEQA
eukprot:2081687-Alexandrium_andersonii.AAC.1